MRPIIPNLWFDANAEEAAAFYVSLFDDSRIVSVTPNPNDPGSGPMAVEWELQGRRYLGINGGPQFAFTEAVSFETRCDTQDEIDRIWAALAEGGEPGPCGWIKDRFGLSWQVTPTVLFDLMLDPATAQAATDYFMSLRGVPFSIADLTAATAQG